MVCPDGGLQRVIRVLKPVPLVKPLVALSLLVYLLLFHVGMALPAGAVELCEDSYNTTFPVWQRLDNAEADMTQEATAAAIYDRSPLTGLVAFDAFISANEVELWGPWAELGMNWYWAVVPNNAQVKILGNGRGQDRYFRPGDSKGMVVLKDGSLQANGWALTYAVLNHTTYRFNLLFPGYTQTVYNHTFSARQPQYGWKRSNRAWWWVDWIDQYTIRMRYEFLLAGPFPASAPAPSIQHQYIMNTKTGAMTWSGTKFPSRAAYRYYDCNFWGTPSIFNASDPNQLENPPSPWPHDAVYSGVKPAWK